MDNQDPNRPVASHNQKPIDLPLQTVTWMSQPQVEDEDDFDFRQLWSVIKHRKSIIILVALGIIGAAAFWTFRKTPIYQGKFQILVGDPIQEADSVDNLILQQWFVSDTDYDTQIEVLRSSSILEPVLPKIKEKYPDFEDSRLISLNAESSPLLIEQVESSKILEISYKDIDPEKIQYILELLSEIYLRYSLEQRKDEVTQGLNYVKQELPGVRVSVEKKQSHLQKFRQKHNLLDPVEQAKQFSEKLVDLEDKLLDTQVQLKDAESLYLLLQQQVGLDPQEAIASSYLSESPRYQNLLNELQEVELELAKQSAIFLPNNPAIQTLIERRANLLPLLDEEAQKTLGPRFSNQISSSSSETSPSSLRLDLTQQLVEAANEIQVLQIRQLALGGEVDFLKRKIELMPSLARQYTELQRELKVATDSLDRFLESEQRLQLESAQQNIPWEIISKPTVGKTPISPKPVRNMALGTIAGVLLGLGAAFLADRLDPVLHSVDELKESVSLPLLGVVPFQKDLGVIEKVLETSLPKLKIGGKTLLNIGREQKQRSQSDYGYYHSSSFEEAFRSLNTNIRLLGSDKSFPSLTITSSIPAEGKSTIALNLAKAGAAMGKRVLLIDADLRKPQIHKRFDLKNTEGLSNLLATGLSLQSLVQSVPNVENLTILTAGDIPPDPTRLLSSERMKQLQSQLEAEDDYDLVIYDTPPVSFADSRILGAITAGLILVARIGRTDRNILRNAIDDLKLSQIPILGLTVNCAKSHSGNYYYNRYYNHYYGDRQESTQANP